MTPPSDTCILAGPKITLSCDFRTCSSDFRSQNPLPDGVGRFLDAPCAGPADMAALSIQGVSKMFAGPVPAVQDLDLEIRDQELVVLVGPSGCGKTTTLRLIAGLEDPDCGVIRFDGRVVNRTAPRDRNVAMVFQHGVLYPHLTVYENMAVGLEWRSVEGGSDEAGCDGVIRRRPSGRGIGGRRSPGRCRTRRNPGRRPPAGSDAPAIVRGRVPASRVGKSHRPPTGGVFVG